MRIPAYPPKLGALATLNAGTGVTSAGGNLSANVTSVAGRTGAVALTVSDVTGAASTASPSFTGTITLGGDTYLRRSAANTLTLGPADSAGTPSPQVLAVQSVAAGTADTAGIDFNIVGSKGTGLGAGGAVQINVAPAGSSGSAQNATVTVVRFAPANSGTTNFRGLLQVGGFGFLSGELRVVDSAGNLAFVLDPGNGSQLRMFNGSGTVNGYFNLGNFAVAAAGMYRWSSTTSANGTADTGLARNAAGVVEVNSGTAGAFRDLRARALIATTWAQVGSYTVATLPSAATAGPGASAWVTDESGGAVLATSTGVVWKRAGTQITIS